MKIRYLGPRQSVGVAPYGPHVAGEIKDYPEEFARNLIGTSRRQQFEIVEESRRILRARKKRSASNEK